MGDGGTAGRGGADSPQRGRILRAAARVFADKGFIGASMSDIGVALGISKQALYHHFRDKQALIADVALTAARELCLHTEARLAAVAGAGAEVRLGAFLDAHAEYFLRERPLCEAAFFGFPALADPAERGAIVEWRHRHERNLRAVIADGVEAGEFGPADVPMAALALLSCLGNLPRWFSEQGALPLAEVLRRFGAVFLDGLRPRAPVAGPRTGPETGTGTGTPPA